MRRVLFIGDIHGRTDWIKWAERAMKEDAYIVMLGDYVDSFDSNKKGYAAIENLQRIVAFKKKMDQRREKVSTRSSMTLLLGNHDYAYLMGKSEASGYQLNWEYEYRDFFNKHWDLFDLAWGYKNSLTGKYTLATHAGVTEDYWRFYISDVRYQESHYGFIEKLVHEPWKTENMHKTINVLKDKFGLLWKLGWERGGSGTPSLIWADIRELTKDPIKGINQVVGHSAYHSPEMFFDKDGSFIAKVDNFGEEVARLYLNL